MWLWLGLWLEECWLCEYLDLGLDGLLLWTEHRNRNCRCRFELESVRCWPRSNNARRRLSDDWSGGWSHGCNTRYRRRKLHRRPARARIITSKTISQGSHRGTRTIDAVATNLVELKAPQVFLEPAVIFSRGVPSFTQSHVLIRVVRVQSGNYLQCVLFLGVGASATFRAECFWQNSFQILSLGRAWLSTE